MIKRSVRCGGPVALSALAVACAATPEGTSAPAAHDPYVATIEVVAAPPGAPGAGTVPGRVFHDRNQDGVMQAGEPGVPGVMVSNGRDVVRTGPDGAYSLPARDDMAVFVIQPSGWRVPTNRDWVPQFAYQHKPAGSPKTLRFGGLPPTGPLPAAINFPLAPSAVGDDFTCAVLGDIQTYANTEVGFMRDSSVDDIVDRGPGAVDCLIAVGDVLGDDLGLIPRLAGLWGAVGAPQWWAHGNHDFDFDADHDADSADSWRRLYGPAYYAFEMGQATFIVLDNVVYPCTAEDAATPGRAHCVEDDRKRYNARVTDDQMAFVEAVVSMTDDDRTIVFAHHIPFVSYVDQATAAHQTDNVAELYAMVEGRNALSLSGHTHTVENLAPGDRFGPWSDMVGVEALPFRHIVAGAVSGAWYNGDLDVHGTPMALGRLGAPRGWLELAFQGGDYRERFVAANMGRERAMWVSLNTPGFRTWFETIDAWRREDRRTRHPVPPLNLYDLPDVKLLTPEDLAGDAYVTANVWAGDSETRVTLAINNGPAEPMIRTQTASGESALIGAAYADPFAVQRQLTVARFAFESRSGDPDSQGYKPYRGRVREPAPPQPQGSVADRNLHLWRALLPRDLPEGVHVATVSATDRHGRVVVDRMVFEVRPARPDPNWRAEVWDAVENGPPVR